MEVIFALADRGMHLFPIKAGRKQPEIAGWRERSTTDKAQLREWAEKFPGCNWAVDAGKSGLLILDVDNHNGVDGAKHLDEWLREKDEQFPTTFCVTTPSGGTHHYYKGRGGNRSHFIKGCDIRGDGGYVLVPGSKIGEVEYRTTADTGPQEAPAWLEEFARATGVKREDRFAPVCELDQPENVAAAAKMLEQAEPAVEGQGGDAHTFRTICRVRDMGISDATCLGMLEAHWNPRCSPPWGADELWAKVENAYRYARDRAGNQTAEGRALEAAGVFDRVDLAAVTRPYRDLGLACPERHWIVDQWIPMGGTCFTLFAGDGGTGKSQLALQLGVSVAAGGLWLGMATRQLPVLYVSCEDDEDELDRRVYHIRKQDPFSGGDRPFWTMCRVGKPSVLCVGQQGRVTPGPFYAELDQVLSQLPEGPKVLFLDTAADMFAGDENSRAEVNAFIKSVVGALGIKHHATIILIAHPSKAQGSTFSGSTAWNNAVRNRLFLRYHDPKKKSSYRVLSNEKANYSAAGGEVMLQYDRGIYVPVARAELQGWVETCVIEIVQAAVDQNQPLSMSKNAVRWVGNTPVTGPGGQAVPVADVLEAVGGMIRSGKLHYKSGQRKGNGLYVGAAPAGEPESKEEDWLS